MRDDVHKVELDPLYPGLGIIKVTASDGLEIRYLLKDGILIPGRTWLSCLRDWQVTFFIPFPDGVPEVLNVEAV